MPEYLTTWVIDIEAEAPRGAAELALVIQRDTSGEATVFVVEDPQTGDSVVVDLSEEDGQ